MNKKIKQYLSTNRWYHGTTLDNAKKIIKNGVIADYNKGNELDFGCGFYLTPKKDQASSFITKILEYNKDKVGESLAQSLGIKTKYNKDKEIPVVIEFDFVPLNWFEEEEYKSKILNSYDNEFAEFVFNNRMNNEKIQHDYDLIFGVMSDSLPIILIQRYKNGELKKDDVIEGLKKQTSAKQLSIHNQNICDIIKVNEIYDIDSGKELDING